jgi:hypothetical protein
MKLLTRISRCLDDGVPLSLDGLLLQRWWIVERVEEGPDSDGEFTEVVGVVTTQQVGMSRYYRQTEVLVITSTLRARKGVYLRLAHSKVYPMELVRKAIDFKVQIFPGWN